MFIASDFVLPDPVKTEAEIVTDREGAMNQYWMSFFEMYEGVWGLGGLV